GGDGGDRGCDAPEGVACAPLRSGSNGVGPGGRPPLMGRVWQDLIGGVEVDRARVSRLHDEVTPRLNRRVAERQASNGGGMSLADEKSLGRHVISEVLADWRAAAYRTGAEPIEPDHEAALARAVHDEIY